MKTIFILSFIVVAIISSCAPSTEQAQQTAPKDSLPAAKVQTSESMVLYSAGGKLISLAELFALANNNFVYFQDPVTHLCFSATRPNAELSTACVPCDSLRNVRVYVLNR